MKKFILPILLFTLLLAYGFQQAKAQCDAGEVEITIEIVADDYPSEISWELNYADGGSLASGNSGGTQGCATAEECLIFTIYDSYGDGICCNNGNGSYSLYLDGVFIATGGDYDDEESVEFNCAAGSSCSSGQAAAIGTNTAFTDNYWYTFVPEQNGQYLLDVCNADCSASVWIYDYCQGLAWNETAANALYFSDGDCQENGAQVIADLGEGQSYFIRIGDANNDCFIEELSWELSYVGPITGCTDPAACSYNPIAEINDPDLCFYLPEEECLASATQVTVGNTTLIEQEIAIDLDVPWEVIYGPDDHLWVTERVGRVQRIEPITGNQTVILDLTGDVQSGSEPGMLGMVLHPDFENVPLVYIAYNYAAGTSIRERLSSFMWDGSNLTGEEVLLNNIGGGGIHNGSRVLITPDNKILMTTGDRGSGNLSQNLEELNGKILRMNLDGSIPNDNPIPNSYIYSFGHRNPQGLCFGPNGLIYSSEHGQENDDEINLIEPNRNYGWPNVEGACDNGLENAFCDANDVVEPLAAWSPCPAVNDIVYYNHPAIPEFQHSILMAVLGGIGTDFERISCLKLSEDGTQIIDEQQYFTTYGRLRDVAINPHTGAIYFATNGSSYPSSGPNRIIEYRNYAWQSDTLTAIVPTPSIAEKQFIHIYPNPIKGQGQVVFSDTFIGSTFEMYSYAGHLVKKQYIGSNTVFIQTDDLTAGAYFIKASNDLGTITRKIIVQ